MMNAALDSRALLATVGHRKVRTVAREDTPYAAALFAVVQQRQRGWQTDEWEAACNELETCELSISEWLQAEHLRARQ